VDYQTTGYGVTSALARVFAFAGLPRKLDEARSRRSRSIRTRKPV
jgi:hypothetical protein